MWRPGRIGDPMFAILVCDQCANVDNRVADVHWELVAACLSDFVIALAIKTICRSKAAKVGTVSISHTRTRGI